MTINISNFAADQDDLGSRTKTARVDCGALATTTNKDVVVTWAVPFPDANYTVVAMMVDTVSTANADALRQAVGAQTASGVTIRITSGTTTSYLAGQLFLHVIAVHD